MKARVKATGEIVEVECVGISNNLHYEVYKVEDLDFDNFDTPDYWTRLEHTYAGMAMQGILSNPESELDYKDDETFPQALAGCAAKVAHALVEKMKEERN